MHAKEAVKSPITYLSHLRIAGGGAWVGVHRCNLQPGVSESNLSGIARATASNRRSRLGEGGGGSVDASGGESGLESSVRPHGGHASTLPVYEPAPEP